MSFMFVWSDLSALLNQYQIRSVIILETLFSNHVHPFSPRIWFCSWWHDIDHTLRIFFLNLSNINAWYHIHFCDSQGVVIWKMPHFGWCQQLQVFQLLKADSIFIGVDRDDGELTYVFSVIQNFLPQMFGLVKTKRKPIVISTTMTRNIAMETNLDLGRFCFLWP